MISEPHSRPIPGFLHKRPGHHQNPKTSVFQASLFFLAISWLELGVACGPSATMKYSRGCKEWDNCGWERIGCGDFKKALAMEWSTHRQGKEIRFHDSGSNLCSLCSTFLDKLHLNRRIIHDAKPTTRVLVVLYPGSKFSLTFVVLCRSSRPFTLSPV